MACRSTRYRKLIAALGMSQRGAAKFFDIGERTSRRWCAGDDVPLAAIMLLEIMVEYRLDPHAIRKLAGAPHSKKIDYGIQQQVEDD